MVQNDVLLTICTTNALSYLEEHFEWDLSLGEQYCCVNAVLDYCTEVGLPKDDWAWKKLFELMYIRTWGKDHECDEPKPEEISVMKSHLTDAFKEHEWIR